MRWIILPRYWKWEMVLLNSHYLSAFVEKKTWFSSENNWFKSEECTEEVIKNDCQMSSPSLRHRYWHRNSPTGAEERWVPWQEMRFIHFPRSLTVLSGDIAIIANLSVVTSDNNWARLTQISSDRQTRECCEQKKKRNYQNFKMSKRKIHWRAIYYHYFSSSINHHWSQ